MNKIQIMNTMLRKLQAYNRRHYIRADIDRLYLSTGKDGRNIT